MVRKLELEGLKFGRWTVLQKSNTRDNQGSVKWDCICDCGTKRAVNGSTLKNGASRSCGCLKDEITSERGRTHGLSRTKMCFVLDGIKDRCYNKNSWAYSKYGGRGITVCDEWVGSFEKFYEDMGGCYSDDLTLERNDVNGDYSSENCTWVSKSAQALNKTLYKNNKSGYTGISYQERTCGLVLVATIQNPLTQKPVVKTRNLRRFAEDEALAFLLDWLEEKREEFGYKHSHGNIKQSKGI